MKISKEELAKVIDRIMWEEESKAKYEGREFIGLTKEQVAGKVCERLGNDWELEMG